MLLLRLCLVVLLWAFSPALASSGAGLCQPPGVPMSPDEAWDELHALTSAWRSLTGRHPGAVPSRIGARIRAGEPPSPALRALLQDPDAAEIYDRLSAVGSVGLSAAPPVEALPMIATDLNHLTMGLNVRAWVALHDLDTAAAAGSVRDLLGLAALLYRQSDDFSMVMATISEELALVAAHVLMPHATDADLDLLAPALRACDDESDPEATLHRLADGRARQAFGLAPQAELGAVIEGDIGLLTSLAALPARARKGSAAESEFVARLRDLQSSPDGADQVFSRELRNVQRHLSGLERGAVLRRGLRLLVALRAACLAHGVYPLTLQELVGPDLSSLPIDPLARQPWIYETSPDRRSMALRATGFDGADDGGVAPRGSLSGLRVGAAGQDCRLWPVP